MSGSTPARRPWSLITGSLLLSWSLMLSQAMELVTRAFYARTDLDLILSSPASAQKVFAVRIGTMAVSVALMAALLAAPFVNVLVALGGPRWLCAYGVVVAMGLPTAACAVAIGGRAVQDHRPETHAPRRADRRRDHRRGLRDRDADRRNPRLRQSVAHRCPGVRHVCRARAGRRQRRSGGRRAPPSATGRRSSSCSWSASLLLGLAIVVFSPRFGDHAIAAASIASGVARRQRGPASFRPATPKRALRPKEWTLLGRDPWLISQTLMQILYLLPPALLLWRNFGEGIGALIVLVPVLVMAAGQLAGGLAWLAISGEDAPDLVATAPVPAGQIVRAKIEAVMGCIAIMFLPFIAALQCPLLFMRSFAPSASSSPRYPRRKSSFGSAPRPSERTFGAGRYHRARRHSRKPSRRSAGPARRCWPRPAAGSLC